MSPVGSIFVPFPPKTGTNLLHPRPPQSLNGSVANDKGWLLRHLDIEHTFIQARLGEAVYTRLPAGCRDMSGEAVLRQRAVYGLR